MSQKTISINPTLFNIKPNSSTRKAKKEKKRKTMPMISPNIMKKKLIEKIREHQKKSLQSNQGTHQVTQNEQTELDDFQNSFQDSLDYLTSLSNKRKENTNIHNNTSSVPNINANLKHTNMDNLGNANNVMNKSSDVNVNINLPTVFSMPQAPPYGCIKNGKKPTYRSWQNQTRKRSQPKPVHQPTVNIRSSDAPQRDIAINMSDREMKLQQLRDHFKLENSSSSHRLPLQPNTSSQEEREHISSNPLPLTMITTQQTSPVPRKDDNNSDNVSTKPAETLKRFTKKTIKKKYKLGKFANTRKIGILIKGTRNRNQILEEKSNIKRRPLHDMKVYLRKHGLIKAGSACPNDVVRELYTNAVMCGNVSNKNKDNLVHNFLNDDI